MPLEAALLDGSPSPVMDCPLCAKPFRPFLRGQVQRSPWAWWQLFGLFGESRRYCALICWECKEIVGYE